MNVLTINVDEYLTEEDKKQIAIDAFKESVFKGLKEGRQKNKTNYDNYERVISNSIHHYLEEKIDELLDTDTEALIKKKVKEIILKKEFSYSLFYTKSAWQKEDGRALTIANQAVEEYQDIMKDKIHAKLDEAINGIGIDNVSEILRDTFNEYLSCKLSS